MPFADGGPTVIPQWTDDDAVLFTDALATGYVGAQLGEFVEGDVTYAAIRRISRRCRSI
ncbi:hypothetical protein [Micromonospora maris]|uniref:hypothetical protein n=1 Tax=Micromonospora maris TaxID=1003110 RepID=UPI002E1151E2|nr:hypothetical protein OG712_15575 [Micromonospora maris]